MVYMLSSFHADFSGKSVNQSMFCQANKKKKKKVMTSHVAVHSICMYIINHPGLGADHTLSFQLFISIQWDIFSCDGAELVALNRGLEQGSERLRRAEIN